MRLDLDLRSFIDTLGGRVVTVISLAAIAAFAGLAGLLQPLITPDDSSDLMLTMSALTLPLSLVIPVLAVMITASEWSDRSVQVTLLQRPNRGALLASKCATALIVLAAVVAVTVGLAALSTWAGGTLIGDAARFDDLRSSLAVPLLTSAATAVFSIAMGVLLQSVVLGVLAAVGIPFVVSTAGVISTLTDSEVITRILHAFDLQTAAMNVGNGEAGAYDLVPLAVLVLLPMAAGAWRWLRREVG